MEGKRTSILVLVQPLQATRAAAFVNGVKACKGRATTKSGCTSTRNGGALSFHFFLIIFQSF
jgi:hypothetical protein